MPPSGFDDQVVISNSFVDEQIRIGMGQAKGCLWVDDILPLLTDEDPLEMERVYHRQAAHEPANMKRRLSDRQGCVSNE